MRKLLLLAIFAIATANVYAAEPRVVPDPRLTPGAINRYVTQSNIGKTICKSGWTKTVRPSVSYTNKIKRMTMAQYGYSGRDPHDFELDHLVSLELGGNPTDPRNLWPEPYDAKVNGEQLGAHTKDSVETHLKNEVCAGRMTLAEAQHEIATDWIGAWRKINAAR